MTGTFNRIALAILPGVMRRAPRRAPPKNALRAVKKLHVVFGRNFATLAYLRGKFLRGGMHIGNVHNFKIYKFVSDDFALT